MANPSLFKTSRGVVPPVADAVNEAGGRAYEREPAEALSQLAATGCLNGTFYASAESQLDTIKALLPKVDVETIAKIALYSREKGYMKDMPALLCAYLCSRGEEGTKMCGQIFDRVIDNGKMLRNFVQMIRSGQFGRKSLGTAPKRFVQRWFAGRRAEALFCDSVGNEGVSLADCIKLARPKPWNDERRAFYAYLIGKEPKSAGKLDEVLGWKGYNSEHLPEIVKAFETWKKNPTDAYTPNVDFRMLTAQPLTKAQWASILHNAGWQMLRMNLNTFARHGVFEDKKAVEYVAEKLSNKEEVARSRCFPYQLLQAFKSVEGVPEKISLALQDAMEHATANVPKLLGQVYVFVDVSGSMHSPISGDRGKGATSKVRCIDVAALIGSVILRQNPESRIIVFKEDAQYAKLNPRDSVMTNAQKLASFNAGGTNCSSALALLNQDKVRGDLCIYVSDSESWLDSEQYGTWGGGSTATMHEWSVFKTRNPKAKLVCIDLQPYTSGQVKERPDILQVGGFSDRVFDVLNDFVQGNSSWLDHIRSEVVI